MSGISPKNVAESLQKVISSRKPSALIEQFIKWALTNYVNAENLKYAIQNNIDILVLAFNHAHLGNPLVSPAFRLVTQMFWSEFVEHYITNPQKIFDILCQKEGVRAILSTPEGIDYLNRCCKSTYESLYEFCWSDYPQQ